MNLNNKKLSEEFHEFMSAEEVVPSSIISKAILQSVHQDLNPSFQQVFLKVLGIHAVVSLATLSLCSQFGFQTLPLFNLMNQFMSFVGETYCMAFCGALFLGISALVFSFLLRPEEVRLIRKHSVLQLTLLAGISLGVFLCAGAQILLIPGVLWVAGSLMGGIVSLQVGWTIRSYFRKRIVYGI